MKKTSWQYPSERNSLFNLENNLLTSSFWVVADYQVKKYGTETSNNPGFKCNVVPLIIYQLSCKSLHDVSAAHMSNTNTPNRIAVMCRIQQRAHYVRLFCSARLVFIDNIIGRYERHLVSFCDARDLSLGRYNRRFLSMCDDSASKGGLACPNRPSYHVAAGLVVLFCDFLKSTRHANVDLSAACWE